MTALLSRNYRKIIKPTGSDLHFGSINREIDTKVLKIGNYIQSSVSNGQVPDILNEIFGVFFECNADNWDGDNAKAITRMAVWKLFILIQNYIPDNLTKPEISPDPDGTIGLEWFGEKGYRMIVIPKGEEILYAALLGSREFHGKTNFNEGLPPEVLNILCYYFHK